MTDIFSKEKRSDIMSRIRSKNTVAELIVFKDLRDRGIYFQKHYTRIAGKPDIALPRKKLAVFIDGDFWHGRTIDQLRARRGDGDDDFWITKIVRNIERDERQVVLLKDNGWHFIRIWESDIKRKSTRGRALEEIATFLKQDNSFSIDLSYRSSQPVDRHDKLAP